MLMNHCLATRYGFSLSFLSNSLPSILFISLSFFFFFLHFSNIENLNIVYTLQRSQTLRKAGRNASRGRKTNQIIDSSPIVLRRSEISRMKVSLFLSLPLFLLSPNFFSHIFFQLETSRGKIFCTTRTRKNR